MITLSEINESKLTEQVNLMSAIYQPICGYHEYDDKDFSLCQTCEERLPYINELSTEKNYYTDEVITLSETNESKLTELVNSLSVVYQPIYGHHEYDDKALRPCQACEERLSYIKKIYDALSAKLNRPLHVLDLGCNNAYVTLSIAEWGCEVTGVEYLNEFFKVGVFLANEHPEFKVKIVQARIEDFIPAIKNDEYDLVLGLSVFHWISKEKGFPTVQNLFKDLAEKIPVGLFEMAKASGESPDFNLPKNYRDHFKDYFFIRLLNNPKQEPPRFRPLCFVSNKYAHFDDFGILTIDKIIPTSSKRKRNFVSGDKFIKMCDVATPDYEEGVKNEIQFLQDLGGQNGLPKLRSILKETDETGTRMFTIREYLKGDSLGSIVYKLDGWNIVEQLLRWMIFFEKHGYYQRDLHLFNFIYTEDRKIIPIDYDLMIHEPISHRWPINIRLTFFWIMNSILCKEGNGEIFFKIEGKPKIYSTGQLLTSFSQHVSEDKYRRILALHDDETFFEKLYDILFKPAPIPQSHTIAEIEILEKEHFLHDLCRAAAEHKNLIDSLNQKVSEQQKRIEQLEKIIKEKLK